MNILNLFRKSHEISHIDFKDNDKIPIYLDTDIVLDLLASSEDGFSQLKEETSSIANEESKGDSKSAQIGFPNHSPIINIGLNRNSSKLRNQNISYKTTRSHTYGSLFNKLREILKDQDKIRTNVNNLESGEFLEVKGVLKLNPLLESLEASSRTIQAINDISKLGESHSQEKELKIVKKQIDDLIKIFGTDEKGFIMDISDDTLVYFDTIPDFFRLKTSKPLAMFECTVIGKVLRIKDNLNLIENTKISTIKESAFAPLVAAFQKLNKDQEMFEVPEFRTSINKKVAFLYPIAIYI